MIPSSILLRFKLKDCIYEQRLEVLSILINETVYNYSNSGVFYVEFSLGVKDLLNLDVWKHLLGAFTSKPKSLRSFTLDDASNDSTTLTTEASVPSSETTEIPVTTSLAGTLTVEPSVQQKYLKVRV